MKTNGNVACDWTETVASVLLMSLGVKFSLRSPSTREVCEKSDLNTYSQHQTTPTAHPTMENLWLHIFSYPNC